LYIAWIDKFNQNNLQSNERFTDFLIRGCLNKGVSKSRIRNKLKDHQISAAIVAAAKCELSIDWLEFAIKVF
jgi:SOS response regulatory protein OraA/RecX